MGRGGPTQIFGGYGFGTTTRLPTSTGDGKVLEIGEGTSEVQRMLIVYHLSVG